MDVAESHGPISWNPLATPRHNRSNRSVFPWRAWSVEHGHPGHHVLEAAVGLAPVDAWGCEKKTPQGVPIPLPVPRLTPDLEAGIAGSVRKGLPNKVACRVAGIGETTFYNWLKRGATAKSGKFYRFWQLLKEAEVDFMASNLAVIQRAANDPRVTTRERVRQNPDGSVVRETTRVTKPPTWQPAAWLLERKFPGEFGRRVVEPGGEMEGSAAAPTIVEINFGDEDEEGKARGTNGRVGRKTRKTPDLEPGIAGSVRKGLSNNTDMTGEK